MFTGIIKATTAITSVQKKGDSFTVGIKKPSLWKIKLGDSISVNGVCSTVSKIKNNILFFDYMPESVNRTNVAFLVVGDNANLEQSLLASDRLDGHVVQGHIDSKGLITSIQPKGNSYSITIKLNKSSLNLITLIAEKGSITVEGISLTVVAVYRDSFEVHVIPYTWEHTNLRTKNVGMEVNVECDILAKYLQQLMKR